jgi:hypothetical protein
MSISCCTPVYALSIAERSPLRMMYSRPLNMTTCLIAPATLAGATSRKRLRSSSRLNACTACRHKHAWLLAVSPVSTLPCCDQGCALACMRRPCGGWGDSWEQGRAFITLQVGLSDSTSAAVSLGPPSIPHTVSQTHAMLTLRCCFWHMSCLVYAFFYNTSAHQQTSIEFCTAFCRMKQ